jgi:hypothetical protein
MRAHDGLLVFALLLVALAAGCKNDRQTDPQTRTATRPPAGRRTTATAPPRTPEAPAPATAADSEPEAEPAADPGQSEVEPATAELRRARQELHDLAEETVSLREALLEARFKAPENQASTDRRDEHDNR